MTRAQDERGNIMATTDVAGWRIVKSRGRRLRYGLVDAVNRILLRRNLVLTASLYSQPAGHSLALAPHSFDFIRAALIRTMAAEIRERGVAGAIAEVGVYQGRTAGLMNALFPDRTMYLFDTFEGFTANDAAKESVSVRMDEFKDTSVEAVLAVMPHRDRCIARKGWFPDTAAGIEDTFCFVSLDVDLYAPTLAGLEWFWPRLAVGGAIMVHDYAAPKFPGPKRAVREFAIAQGIGIVALPDSAGSALLVK